MKAEDTDTISEESMISEDISENSSNFRFKNVRTNFTTQNNTELSNYSKKDKIEKKKIMKKEKSSKFKKGSSLK